MAWKYLCLSVEKGGLGLKNMEDFNVALLSKWKWCIIKRTEEKWMDILIARYGNICLNIQNKSSYGNSTKSTWWKDLINLDKGKTDREFMAGCRIAVGNGKGTSFWNATWLSIGRLKTLFMELYDMSNTKHLSVYDVGVWS